MLPLAPWWQEIQKKLPLVSQILIHPYRKRRTLGFVPNNNNSSTALQADSRVDDDNDFHNDTAGTVAISTWQNTYNPLRLYRSCMMIVVVWVSVGSLFYSVCNDWPLHQAFFYAVDAGMSIGFCTQVYETKLVSKAFTIAYILLGASVIVGALALFLQEAVEGLSTPSIQEYEVWLEKQVFDQADVDHTGVLTYEEFKNVDSIGVSCVK